MAHTKSGGSSDLGRDSASKRLGVKRNHGQKVLPGQIIIRQRGSKYVEGVNVRRGGDDTLYALKKGVVQFANQRKTRFDGSRRSVKKISVVEQL